MPYAEKHLCKVFYYKIMKKLSLEDTQNLVNSFVKSFGQSGAAQKLTEKGYRSPTGAQILQAHVFRILHGSSTCLLGPETENQEQKSPTEEPIATIPKMQKKIASELFTDEELQQEITKTAKELREELEEEQAAIKEMEASLPPLIPSIGDRPHRAARHMEKYIRVSGIFNHRQAVQLDEDRSFFGIPRLKHSSPVTICRPYQPRSYARNSISSRDLFVHQK